MAAVSGFGVGSLLTPLLLLGFSAADAVTLVALPHVLATAIRFWGLRADLDRPTFRQFGLASAVGGLAGAALQTLAGGSALTLILGALLLAAGTSELVGRPLPLPSTPGWRLAGGALSGAFGGLVGNQGGLRSAALLGFGLEGRALVATATASALLVDAARVPLYVATRGSVIAQEAGLVLVASAGVTIGTWIGVPLLRRIPPALYRRLLGALLVLLALGLLLLAVR